MSRPRSFWTIALTSCAALALVASGAVPAQAEPNNNTSRKLRDAVTLQGLTEHLQALQQIADENGGNRFAGLPGHDASVEYAVGVFQAAGYRVTVQPFQYLAAATLGPSALQQTAPGSVTYLEGTDFQTMGETDSGDVTAAVTAVDLQLGPANTSTQRLRSSRLRRVPGWQHRPHPARHLHLRAQGTQRSCGRRRRRRDLMNEGNTPAPDGPDRRHTRGDQRFRHPGAGASPTTWV